MRSLLLVPALALASLSFGLGLGDKAPPLKVQAIVKGKAVDLSKGVHVVEFWATWCGPCKDSIPHLTELAKKYKGKADVTGVSINEVGAEQLGQVKKFVNAMGSKMDYNVAWDGPSKTMSATWMDAAKQGGIPTAFLVKDGQIQWIGHPMDGLDQALEKVVAGTYDLAAVKAKMDDAVKQQAEMKALMQPFTDAMNEGNVDDAMTELDAVETKKPEMRPMVARLRFNVLLGTGNAQLPKYAKKYVVDFEKDAETLNSLAWAIIDPEVKLEKRDYASALLLAEQAAKASKMEDGMILDTYALALFKTGDKKKAIELQTKAVEIYRKDKEVDPKTLKEMEDRLAEFKKTPNV